MAEITITERQNLISYLNEGRDRLLSILASVEGDQWTFKPGPDDWSILEILEHIVIVERRVHNIIASAPDAPFLPPGMAMQPERELVEMVERRAGRIPASPAAQPTGQVTPQQALSEFGAAREKTLQLVDAPALRGHVLPHPVCGFWDGYRWLLGAAAHSNRHAAQIQEVMSHPACPAALVSV